MSFLRTIQAAMSLWDVFISSISSFLSGVIKVKQKIAVVLVYN
jgi:hypothetical protein